LHLEYRRSRATRNSNAPIRKFFVPFILPNNFLFTIFSKPSNNQTLGNQNFRIYTQRKCNKNCIINIIENISRALWYLHLETAWHLETMWHLENPQRQTYTYKLTSPLRLHLVARSNKEINVNFQTIFISIFYNIFNKDILWIALFTGLLAVSQIITSGNSW